MILVGGIENNRPELRQICLFGSDPLRQLNRLSKILMSMQRAMVSVAQNELRVLVEDTRSAIGNLKRQGDSVMQALEIAQQAGVHPDDPLDETDDLAMRVLDELRRLSAALDQVIHETEHIEASPTSPNAGPFLVLSLQSTQVVDDSHPALSATTRT